MRYWFRQAAAIASIFTSMVFASRASAGDIELKPLPGAADYGERFYSYYKPVPLDLKPGIASYPLPLTLTQVSNYDDVSGKLHIPPEGDEMLSKNGFVVLDYGRVDDIVEPYRDLKKRGVPIFITSDTLLHLYHIQFDETLKEIEEKEFSHDLIGISREMMEESLRDFKKLKGNLKEAARRNVAFFTVGLRLLEPDSKIPKPVSGEVQWELEQIETHQGFPGSPFNPADVKRVEEKSIFRYMEDYSQYVPRGHYTRSETLKRYFKAMMWYGRMTFLLKGKEPHGPISPPAKALVSPESARVQTLQACLIAAKVDTVKVERRTVAELWDRIYLVTGFYVGFSDDLSIYDYREAVRSVFGSGFNVEDLDNDQKLGELKREFAKRPSPKIYGGTGQSGVMAAPGEPFAPERLDSILGNTLGMRFMGQRFVPDSYVMSQLVSPAAGDYIGSRQPRPFTWVLVPLGEVRGYPRGLDVMSLLGSTRAMEILTEEGDTEYSHYREQYRNLEKEFSGFGRKEWNMNLYWSWLDSLRSLVVDFPEGYQSFMRTKAWQDKELNAALGSWASLRHDTILYVKQSYTPTLARESAAPRPVEKPVVGYVEPVPEFYAKLMAMARMTTKGLSDMHVLDEASRARLVSLEGILGRLVDISEKELRNQGLVEGEYEFIRGFGEQLAGTVAGVGSEGMKTTIIADVHTDQNEGKVLEEGTGYVDLLLAAYRVPDGRILIGAGPVFSYYEFKHPMADRLTDGRWREMLLHSREPDRPGWARSFLGSGR